MRVTRLTLATIRLENWLADTRASLGLLLGVLSGVVLVVVATGQDRVTDAVLNLMTEGIGIGITVVILDQLAELRRKRDEVGELTRLLLHRLHHLVWLWQGGSPGFDPRETLVLLRNVESDAHLHPATTRLLREFAAAAERVLLQRRQALAGHEQVLLAVVWAVRLGHPLDSGRVVPKQTAAALLPIANKLLDALDLLVPVPRGSEPTDVYILDRRDASIAAQERRIATGY